MTADDAFDKLVEKNALNIPVVKPSTEGVDVEMQTSNWIDGDNWAGGDAMAGEIPTAVRHPVDSAGEAIRVLNILEGDDVREYNPRGYDDDSDSYSTPTETDLDAVDGELGSAYAHGAQVLGRDIDPGEFFEEIVDAQEVSESETEVGDMSPAAMQAYLEKARRVRRYSYLPLTGMEHFETRARDIMAMVTAATPTTPSLAVTSVSRGSGQAELAIRLALAAAKRVDYRVLLADFDVRKPQVAKRLGLSSKYFTLADVLRDSCPLGEALMVSEEDNLYVLPARASDRDGDEVLNDRQVQNLLALAHGAFDFVVVSCGPLDHADATIVCRHCGAAALSAFCGHSSARDIRSAASRLSEVGVNVAGLLLAGANP